MAKAARGKSVSSVPSVRKEIRVEMVRRWRPIFLACPFMRLELPVQLKATLTSAIARLSADHVPSPRLNAETLLMFTLDCDRAYLFAHPERELTDDQQSRYQSGLAERARGVPAPAAVERTVLRNRSRPSSVRCGS